MIPKFAPFSRIVRYLFLNSYLVRGYRSGSVPSVSRLFTPAFFNFLIFLSSFFFLKLMCYAMMVRYDRAGR